MENLSMRHILISVDESEVGSMTMFRSYDSEFDPNSDMASPRLDPRPAKAKLPYVISSACFYAGVEEGF